MEICEKRRKGHSIFSMSSKKLNFFLIYELQYVITLSNFGLHESLKNNHRFRHLPFRRTSQLIVTFIRPVINFNKGLSFLIQLFGVQREALSPTRDLLFSKGMLGLLRHIRDQLFRELALKVSNFTRGV